MIVPGQVMAQLKFKAESAGSQAEDLIIKHNPWKADLYICDVDRPLV